MEKNDQLENSLLHHSVETRVLVLQYLQQMNEKEKKAYTIAKEHLGTSFNIVKSIGYIDWNNRLKSSK